MNKKCKVYAAMTCLMFVVVLMVTVLILDIILKLNWQLVFAMFLFCAACLPLWLIVGDILAQYYESEVKRRNRRKLIIVPYTTPTKSEKPIQFSKPSVIPDTGIKVYRNKSGSVELRNIISVSNSEADTQIYSIKSK